VFLFQLTLTDSRHLFLRNARMSKEPKPSSKKPVSPDKVSDEDKTVDDWVEKLYSLPVSEFDLKNFYETIQYQGFNRKEVLKQLHQKFPDLRIATEVIIAIAVRGPQRGSSQKLSSGKTIQQFGISASGGKGTNILTCNKIGAATADLAAYYLKFLNAPKRLSVECPAWLQFPSAASIKMPDDLRKQHIEFSKRFSQVIGGVFNEDIYAKMADNSYLELKLGLFQ
jgi:hypothetical protein